MSHPLPSPHQPPASRRSSTPYTGYVSQHLGHLGHAPDVATYAMHAARYAWNFGPMLAGVDRSAPVLDLGCGVGEGLLFFAQAGFRNIRGIDLSREAVEAAERFFEQTTSGGQPRPVIEQADAAEYLARHGGAFGVILMSDVVEHLDGEALDDLLDRCRMALRPGGLLLIKTPNMDCPLASAWRYRDATHRTGFTATSLRQVLRRAGFGHIEFRREEAPETSWRRRWRRRVLRGAFEAVTRLAWYAHEMGPAPAVLSPWLLGVARVEPAATGTTVSKGASTATPTAAAPRVLFVGGGARMPASRFRVEAMVPALQARGWRVRMAHCWPARHVAPPAWAGRLGWWALTSLQALSALRHLTHAHRHDVVVLQRELSPWPSAFFERLLRGFARRLVLDVDDAIHLLYPRDANGRAARIDDIARTADLIIVGNANLQSYMAPLQRPVAVLPTPIDTLRLTPRPTGEVDPLRLVWVGSSSTLAELEDFLPHLGPVAAAHPGLRLRVVADRPPAQNAIPAGLAVDFMPWSPETECHALDDALLGLMPLRDTPFNQGKCGLKILLYMARAVAPVASAVGANSSIIRQGASGVLTPGHSELAQAVQALLRQPARALALGQQARHDAEERWSVAHWAPELDALLRGGAPPAPPPPQPPPP